MKAKKFNYTVRAELVEALLRNPALRQALKKQL